MNTYLMDTNIASALWDEGDKDHSAAVDFVKRMGIASHFNISVITYAEVKWGFLSFPAKTPEHKNRRKIIEKKMKHHFPEMLPIDRFVVDYYAKLRAALVNYFAPWEFRDRIKKGIRIEDLVDEATGKLLGIQENDLWQTAIALRYKCVLVTEDKMNHIRKAADIVHDSQPEINLNIRKWRAQV